MYVYVYRCKHMYLSSLYVLIYHIKYISYHKYWGKKIEKRKTTKLIPVSATSVQISFSLLTSNVPCILLLLLGLGV